SSSPRISIGLAVRSSRLKRHTFHPIPGIKAGYRRGQRPNLISHWNRGFLYDLMLQSFTEPYNAISSDGVYLAATVSVRFRLQRDAVHVLHQAIGLNYEQVLVQHGIGSLTRQVIAEYNAEQAYSSARQEIQDKIRNLVEERLSEKMMEHAG